MKTVKMENFETDIEAILVLYRHWIWTDIYRSMYYKEQAKNRKTSQNVLYTSQATFMYTWYAMLYELIKFVKKRKINMSAVAQEINDVGEELFQCRNAIFHIQQKITSEKLTAIINQPGSRNKINKIHREIGSYSYKQLINIGRMLKADGKKMISDITGVDVKKFKDRWNQSNQLSKIINFFSRGSAPAESSTKR